MRKPNFRSVVHLHMSRINYAPECACTRIMRENKANSRTRRFADGNWAREAGKSPKIFVTIPVLLAEKPSAIKSKRARARANAFGFNRLETLKVSCRLLQYTYRSDHSHASLQIASLNRTSAYPVSSFLFQFARLYPWLSERLSCSFARSDKHKI